MNINLIFRHKTSGFHSIEELFGTLQPRFSEQQNVRRFVLPYHESGIINRFRNILFARRFKGGINHITGHVHYLVMGLRKGNIVLTIHDMIPLFSYKGIKRGIIKLFWYTLPVKKANMVTVISEKTKEELLQNVKVSSKKIRVIPNCVSKDFAYRQRVINVLRPVLLCVGTKPNKNLEGIIKAVKDISCELAILGKINDQQKRLLSDIAIPFSEYYDLEKEEIINLYRNCYILIFPSTYEGFGVPILEAQATGRAVITSDLSPMREVAGEGALLVDPFEVEDIRNGILKVIKDDEYREKLIQKGLENVKRYSAEKITSMYLDMYKEVEKNNN